MIARQTLPQAQANLESELNLVERNIKNWLVEVDRFFNSNISNKAGEPGNSLRYALLCRKQLVHDRRTRMQLLARRDLFLGISPN
jgi:hypothetical protein